MSGLWLRFPFEVQNLRAAKDLPGSALSLEYNGVMAKIAFPDQVHQVEAVAQGESRWHLVRQFFVQIELPNFRLEDFVNHEDGYEVPSEVLAAFSSAAGTAVDIANSFIDRVRTWLGQFWISSTADHAYVIGAIEAREGDAEWRVIPFAHGPVRLRSRSFTPLGMLTTASIARGIQDGMQVGIEELLLADARLQAEQSSADWRYCILVAAIACEIKVKNALIDLAKSSQSDLVELLFNHPRDYSVAVLALYDKALFAVCGHSLRNEDKELYKRLKGLIDTRNKIVHRDPAVDSIPNPSEHLRTARDVFFFLDSLLAMTGSVSGTDPGLVDQ